MDKVRFEWVVEESALNESVAITEEAGAEVLEVPKVYEPTIVESDDYGDHALEPMTVIAVALSIGALTRIVSEVIRQHKYPGGVVLDIRGGKLKKRPVPRLEPGTIIIITDDGQTKFPPDKKEDALAALGRFDCG